MNNRIQELARQAAGVPRGSSVGASDMSNWAAIERFAELIVKECADVCYDADYQGPAYSELILKHFGVEE